MAKRDHNLFGQIASQTFTGRTIMRMRSGGGNSAGPRGSKSFRRDIFRIDGRRNRKSLALSMAFVGLVFMIAAALSFSFVERDDLVVFNDHLLSGKSLLSSLLEVQPLLRAVQAFLVILGMNFLATFCLIGQRFRDMGLSGKWALLAIVPYLNLGILAASFMIPSWPGANQYGPDPRSGKNTGRWI